MLQPTNFKNFLCKAFTILEVMVATLILAIGMSAALNAIYNNNNLRRSLDENAMADLVLRQMTARLKSVTNIQLGHAYENSDGNAHAWTLHLRATASASVPAATSSAPALTQPYSSTTNNTGPFRPLTEQDLVTAGILREPVGLNNFLLYVEYYNLSTITGLVNVDGTLVPEEEGLINRYSELQEANPTGNHRQFWYSLVGDPNVNNRLPKSALSPSDSEAENFILPAVFSLSNIDQPGIPEKIRGAFNHGLVIRILISWRPSEIIDPNSTFLTWRETIIVKRN